MYKLDIIRNVQAVVANFLSYTITKYYKNRSTFDGVNIKIKFWHGAMRSKSNYKQHLVIWQQELKHDIHISIRY